MRKSKFERNYASFLPEIFLFILASLLIVWFFGLLYLLFFLLIILCTYILVDLFNTQRREQTILLAKTKALSDARLILLKELITLAYETDKDLFHKKFKAAVCIKKLRGAGVLEINSKLLYEKAGRHMACGTKKKISRIAMLNFVAC